MFHFFFFFIFLTFYNKHFQLKVGLDQPFLITLLYIWQCFLHINFKFNVFIVKCQDIIDYNLSLFCNLSKKSRTSKMNLLHIGQRDPPTHPYPLYSIPPFKILLIPRSTLIFHPLNRSKWLLRHYRHCSKTHNIRQRS